MHGRRIGVKVDRLRQMSDMDRAAELYRTSFDMDGSAQASTQRDRCPGRLLGRIAANWIPENHLEQEGPQISYKSNFVGSGGKIRFQAIDLIARRFRPDP